MTDPNTFDVPPDEFRRLGHRVIDLMAEAIAAERADPVIRPISGEEIRRRIDGPLPQRGRPIEEVFARWRDDILPYSRRHGHPRFFGYVCTSADPFGMLADAMASALNQTVTAWRSTPAAIEVERMVVRWLDEFVGFGGSGSGVLTSGGSSANLHALACAVGRAESRAGLPSGERGRLTIYLSREGHLSMRKAARLLGLAEGNVIQLPVDEHRRMRVDQLLSRIEQDRRRGLVPAAVCASAGTANTGTIDPLDEIADMCSDEAVWMHIDGSYGAPASITDEYAWMRAPFSRADSLSLDPHKWLFAPADVGAILVRDVDVLHHTFAEHSEYTAVSQTDPIERYAMFDHGLEMTRRFRGLKVLTILEARGVQAVADVISRNIALRKHLDDVVDRHPRLEHLGSELSIACFRYVPEGGAGDDRIDVINRRIIDTVVAEGACYMSPTTLDGRYSLRACIVNFRTTERDIDMLLNDVVRIGDAA